MGHFHPVVGVDSAAVNLAFKVPVFIYLRHMPRSGRAESWGDSVAAF